MKRFTLIFAVCLVCLAVVRGTEDPPSDFDQIQDVLADIDDLEDELVCQQPQDESDEQEMTTRASELQAIIDDESSTESEVEAAEAELDITEDMLLHHQDFGASADEMIDGGFDELRDILNSCL